MTSQVHDPGSGRSGIRTIRSVGPNIYTNPTFPRSFLSPCCSLPSSPAQPSPLLPNPSFIRPFLTPAAQSPLHPLNPPPCCPIPPSSAHSSPLLLVPGAGIELTERTRTAGGGQGIDSLRCCILASADLRNAQGTSLPSVDCSPPLQGSWGTLHGPTLSSVALHDPQCAPQLGSEPAMGSDPSRVRSQTLHSATRPAWLRARCAARTLHCTLVALHARCALHAGFERASNALRAALRAALHAFAAPHAACTLRCALRRMLAAE